MAAFKKSSLVQWKWLGRVIAGVVVEVHEAPVTMEIKGKKIKRNGSKEKPAYLVESEAGNRALKLESELTARAKVDPRTPKMFRD